MNKTLSLVAVAMLSCSAAYAADESSTQPSNALRLGIYFIRYHATADDISGPFVPPGVNLDVKNVNTAYFAYVRRLTSALELEFAAGYPPKTKTVGKGPATVGSVPYDGEVVATAKWFSPTLLVNYKFLDESAPLRPYVGLGINYTHFYDRTSTDAGNAANGGPTTIKLSDSIGPAATVGVSYRLQQNWSINASYSRAKVKSDLELNTSGVVRRSTINFNPSSWVISAGYHF